MDGLIRRMKTVPFHLAFSQFLPEGAVLEAGEEDTSRVMIGLRRGFKESANRERMRIETAVKHHDFRMILAKRRYKKSGGISREK